MPDNMTKKGKKKPKIVYYDSDTDGSPTPRVELIYEDTKSVTEAKPEFKWGQIYHMLVEKRVPEAGLEDALYDNILRSGLTKASTRPEMFPCAQVIGWILPKVDVAGKIMNNVEDKGFASSTPGFIAK